MKKTHFNMLVSLILGALAVVTGGGAMMAIAGTLSETDSAGTASAVQNLGASGANSNGGAMANGVPVQAANNENPNGIASQSNNAALEAAANINSGNGAEGFDSRGLSRDIMEIEPMKTPFDQITRKATTGEKPTNMYIEYASIGSRPTETTTTDAFTLAAPAQSAILKVADPQIFSVDDVVIAVGVKATNRYDGVAYSTLFTEGSDAWPNLQLKICGFDDATAMPVAYCMNGSQNAVTKQNTCGTIPSGTKLMRIAKALNEMASQTGRVAEMPNTDLQYLQIFAVQTEESTLHKLIKRDVNGLDLTWHERRTLQDMRMVQEGTFLLSDMTKIMNHPKENNATVWTTKGAWYQAGKDCEFGHLEYIDASDTSKGQKRVVCDDDLVNINADIFVGEGTGNVKKIWFAGSDFITELEKIKSEKFRLKGDVKFWDLTFTSWKTTLGEVLVIYCETLNKYGMSDRAFSLDPEYFEKRVLQSLDRHAIDLEAMGVRATQAVVLKEISCVILYAPLAHARIKLIEVPTT